jgi:predicted metalloprotease with PDZ domain
MTRLPLPRATPAPQTRNGPRGLFAAVLLLAAAQTAAAQTARPIEVEVDARDLPRKLVRTTMTVPCDPGKLKLWYPKWIPGSHGPFGRLEDVGGLKIETPDGKTLAWKRDDVELNCVACDVPTGTTAVVVRLDTICNVSSPGAIGVYSYGNARLGCVNWNTCVLYPEVPNANDLKMTVSLRLPAKWKFASSLKIDEQKDGRVAFQTTTLETLIDSPLIAGEHFRSIKLDTGKNPPAYLDLVTEQAAALKLDDETVGKYGRLVREGCDLFGAAHFDEYRFLVVCSDDLGSFGLEHHACSFNGVGDRDLIDADRRRGWVAGLLPHEFVHSWCGKFRRPAEMCVPDLHTPQRTKLLWVYEGLTTYLGDILTARSGLMTTSDYREMLALNLSDQIHRKGRRWRPLEDTATANHLLRNPSAHWGELRRDQDYYNEGALLWWEADLIIRDKSKGKKSLDDFCRAFMGPLDTKDKVVPYTLKDVVAALKEQADHDWDGFFARRVSAPMEAFPLDVVEMAGYRVGYAKALPNFVEFALWQGDKTSPAVTARDSLGLTFSADGRIKSVVPESVADKNGLSPDAQVVAVNGRKFSQDALTAGLEASLKTKKVEFLVLEGDRYRTVAVEYAGGPKYLELVRVKDKPDLLADILKPRLGKKGKE